MLGRLSVVQMDEHGKPLNPAKLQLPHLYTVGLSFKKWSFPFFIQDAQIKAVSCSLINIRIKQDNIFEDNFKPKSSAASSIYSLSLCVQFSYVEHP